MAGVFIVVAACPIAKMPNEKFCRIVEISLNRIDEFRVYYAALHLVVVEFKLLFKNMGQSVLLGAARAEDKIVPGRNTDLHRTYSGSVLAAVVLLFHKEEKLIKAVKWRAVLAPIIVQGL